MFQLHLLGDTNTRRITWVIAGGESGPRARPSHPNWFRAVRDQCAAAGVPFLFKQWGEWGPAASVPSNVANRRWNSGGEELIARFGKANTGRTLDGREHSEFP